MPIPEAFALCLSDLSRHIENLQAELDSVRAQNEMLRKLSPAPLPPEEEKKASHIELEQYQKRRHQKVLDNLRSQTQHLALPGTADAAPPPVMDAQGEMLSNAPFLPEGKVQGQGSTPSAGRARARRVSTDCIVSEFKMTDARKSKGRIVEGSLASDKFNMLKTDPYQLEEFDKHRIKDLSEGVKAIFKTDPDATLMERLTASFIFQAFTMLAIGANTCYLGMQADFNAKNSYRPIKCQIAGESGTHCVKEEEWILVDAVFAGWFALEIVFRIAAGRLQFFTGEDRNWNLFDFALVVESLIGLALNTGRLNLLRILRVFRLIRIIRLVRTVKILRRLRTMIFSILNSFIDLLWALLVVGLVVFVFSITFCNAVAGFYDEVVETSLLQDQAAVTDAAAVNVEFGSLYASMIALWSAISGGMDWMEYGALLRKMTNGELYFVIFQFYLAFCVVGMFNVVTGVFVDSAVCCRTEDEVVQGYIDELRSTTNEIKDFFRSADIDRSGTLSFEEFQNHLQDPLVKAYFSGLDIDPSEASIIFTILDADKSDELRIDEFVNGTMKLKGSATKLDVMAMMFDNTRQTLKFDSLVEFVEEEFSGIKQALEILQQRPSAAPSVPSLHINGHGFNYHGSVANGTPIEAAVQAVSESLGSKQSTGLKKASVLGFRKPGS